ncbi:hypothetical protein D3C73_1611490 [compost metagenome]
MNLHFLTALRTALIRKLRLRRAFIFAFLAAADEQLSSLALDLLKRAAAIGTAGAR